MYIFIRFPSEYNNIRNTQIKLYSLNLMSTMYRNISVDIYFPFILESNGKINTEIVCEWVMGCSLLVNSFTSM